MLLSNIDSCVCFLSISLPRVQSGRFSIFLFVCATMQHVWCTLASKLLRAIMLARVSLLLCRHSLRIWLPNTQFSCCCCILFVVSIYTVFALGIQVELDRRVKSNANHLALPLFPRKLFYFFACSDKNICMLSARLISVDWPYHRFGYS